MIHKNSILMILLITNTIAMGMKRCNKIQPKQTIIESCGLHKNSLNAIPKEIPTGIGSYVLQEKEWWYLTHEFSHDSAVHAVCFDHTDTRLATGSLWGTQIFDINKRTKISSFPHTKHIGSLCFNHSGNLLAAQSPGLIRLYDLNTKKKKQEFPHVGAVYSMNFNSSDELFATGAYFQQANILNAKTGKQITSFTSDNWINAVCFEPTQDHIAIGSPIGKISLFHIKSGEKIMFPSCKAAISTIRFNTQETRLVIGSFDGKMHVFDIENKRKIASFAHDEAVNSVFFNNAGNLLASACSDKKARIFRRYEHWTLEQLVFKKILHSWLLIEKPDKKIDSLILLSADIEHKFGLKKEELTTIWMALPEALQSALWRTLQHKIQQHGK